MSETIFEAPLDVAMEIAHNVAPPKEIVQRPTDACIGQVLATDVIAQSDLPPFAASRVDGYAICGQAPWELVGTNLAGDTTEIELTAGQCIYVATGAQIPLQTSAVIKQEDCNVDAMWVQLKNGNQSITTGENIRPAGFEAKQNEIVIKTSTKLTPALLGLAAACGYETLSVYQKPKVDVLIFGDELISYGSAGSGKVRDAIGPQMSAWLDLLGGELNQINFVPDNLTDHVKAIAESSADLIITTGGTASGPADHLHSAITECSGVILIDAVKVRPGYHQLLAQLPNKFLIGLPGNPQSAVIGLLTLVRPFINGSTNQVPQLLSHRILATKCAAPIDEHRFVLARELRGLSHVGQIETVEFLDSSMLRGFVDADGYAIIEPGGLPENSVVPWLPLPK